VNSILREGTWLLAIQIFDMKTTDASFEVIVIEKDLTGTKANW
jgi:hypothetical protein